MNLDVIEKNVSQFLVKLFTSHKSVHPHVLVAVSGGVDSVVLLTVLHRLSSVLGFSLSVQTVDHKIRSPAESGGDANFVVAYATSLGLSCMVTALPDGAVAEYASSCNGVEDAARTFRYKALEAESKRIHADFIALGHTKNDQLETVLMRVLQGCGAGGIGGIKQIRLPFIRPLLDVSRTDIELYAQKNALTYRTDVTNSDFAYLRNRIRLRLMPELDAITPGWQRAIQTLAEKSSADESFIQNFVEKISIMSRRCSTSELFYLFWRKDLFCSAAQPVQLRFLQRVISQLVSGRRIPYAFFMSAAKSICTGKNVAACGLIIQSSDKYIFAANDIVQNFKTGYLVHGVTNSTVETPYFRLTCQYLSATEYAINRISASMGSEVYVPVLGETIIRSADVTDSIAFANGNRLSFKEYVAKENIPAFLRSEIPVIVSDSLPVCFAGSAFGFASLISDLPAVKSAKQFLHILFKFQEN